MARRCLGLVVAVALAVGAAVPAFADSAASGQCASSGSNLNLPGYYYGAVHTVTSADVTAWPFYPSTVTGADRYFMVFASGTTAAGSCTATFIAYTNTQSGGSHTSSGTLTAGQVMVPYSSTSTVPDVPGGASPTPTVTVTATSTVAASNNCTLPVSDTTTDGVCRTAADVHRGVTYAIPALGVLLLLAAASLVLQFGTSLRGGRHVA